MAESKDDKVIKIKIENKNPIELIDLTEAFLCLGDEYRRYAETLPDVKEPKEIKLYIQEIKTGSIDISLVELAPLILPFMERTVVIVEFSKYVANVIKYFSGKSDDKPKLDSKSYDNFSKIVNPVAKDNGSQMIFQNVVSGNVEQHFHFDSTEANAIQNRLGKEKALLKEPNHEPHEKVVLYWYQARDEAGSQVGDRGIIETISSKAVKVIFASDEMKTDIIHDKINPFRLCYVVDVTVETVQGSPVAYKILKIHEKFDRPL